MNSETLKKNRAARAAQRKEIMGDRKTTDLRPDELMQLAHLADEDERDALEHGGVISSSTTAAELNQLRR